MTEIYFILWPFLLVSTIYTTNIYILLDHEIARTARVCGAIFKTSWRRGVLMFDHSKIMSLDDHDDE